MKILHFSDVHIGMENYGKIDPKTGLNTRFLDFLNSLDEIVEHVKKTKPDLVLFAGDAYKDRTPTPTHQREFAVRIKKMAALSPIVLVVGNHDLPQALEKANTLDIFSALLVQNVTVSRGPEVLKIQTNSGPIQILTLPWITKGKLLEKNQFSGKSQEEIQKLLSQKLAKIIAELTEKLDSKIPAIAAAHVTCESAIYGSERSVMLGQDLTLPEKVFVHPKIKYTGLGHIHKFQVLRKQPPIVYSGSINRIDFGEEKDKKGFVQVEINNKTEFKFIPLKTRKFTTIKIDLLGVKDPILRIKKEIEKKEIKDTIVRVQVKVPEEKTEQITDSDIRRYLGQAHYITSVSFETPETKKVREIKYFEQSASPLDTLDEYLKFRKFPKTKREILKEYTERLVEEIE